MEKWACSKCKNNSFACIDCISLKLFEPIGGGMTLFEMQKEIEKKGNDSQIKLSYKILKDHDKKRWELMEWLIYSCDKPRYRQSHYEVAELAKKTKKKLRNILDDIINLKNKT